MLRVSKRSVLIALAAGWGCGSPSYVIVHQPVVTVRVTPALDTLPFGGTVALQLTTLDLSGQPTIPDHHPVWTSLTPSIFTVDTVGNVAAIWYGLGTIRVVVDGVEGDAQLVALAPPIISVSVLSPNLHPELGDTVQFQVTAVNAARLPASTAGTRWTVSDLSKMRVDSTGRGIAIGVGPVTVRAALAGLSDSATEAVLVPAASVTLSPSTLTLAFGAIDSFQVTVRDSAGDTLTDHPIAVSTSAVVQTAPLVSPPEKYVTVRGVAAGTGTVQVAVGRVRDSGTVTVGAPQPLTFRSAVAGGAFTCAVTVDSAAYCWGWGHGGELGTGDTVSGPQPRAVAGGLKFASLTAGPEFACGVTGAGAAYCWGANATQQLGRSGGGSSTPIAVGGGNQYTALDAHFSRLFSDSGGAVCGLASGGQVYCWGSGWGTAPVPVGTPGFIDRLALGALGFCGVRSSDTAAFCWSPSSAPGRIVRWDTLPLALEDRGSWALECGISRLHLYCGGSWPSSSTTWTAMSLLPANPITLVAPPTEAAAGVSHECVNLVTAVMCRGDDTRGQIGTTSGSFTDTFLTVSAFPTPFTGLEAGWAHTCLFGGDGLLYCWGDNSFGQVGSALGSAVFTPQPVMGQAAGH